jgi:hypothetical protein
MEVVRIRESGLLNAEEARSGASQLPFGFANSEYWLMWNWGVSRPREAARLP